MLIPEFLGAAGLSEILLLIFAFGCVRKVRAPAVAEPRADAVIHVVSTTDLHGHLLAGRTRSGLPIGGVDVMAGYFNLARRADSETVFLDSGDLFQGTIVSNASDGATVVKWMNYAGYLAAAVGNHEFDFGPGHGQNEIEHPEMDPLGALKARAGEARFALLSANLCSVSEDPGGCSDPSIYQVASLARPYLIHEVHGIRLGVIGLTTPRTPETTMPVNVRSLRFMPMRSALERFVTELRGKADVIIVVMHDGGFCRYGGCDPKDPVFKLIDSLDPGIRSKIPLILAGHTHNYVNTVYRGVRVMITGCYGRSFGYSTLRYRGKDGGVTIAPENARRVDFCSEVYPDTRSCFRGRGAPVKAAFLGSQVAPDPAALGLIRGDIDAASAVAGRVVGKAITPLTMTPPGPEYSLGDMMADTLRWCGTAACAVPVDMAFENDGGIRSSIIDAGPVTYGQIFETEPFDDFYSELELTGSQVRDLLVSWHAYDGKMPQVSGLRIVYSSSWSQPRKIINAAGETRMFSDPIVILETADGESVLDRRLYRVAMSAFLALGGGGPGFALKGLRPGPAIRFDRKLRDMMVDYFRARPSGWDYSTMGNRLVLSP